MSTDYPAVMDDWYDDATEGDLSGGDITGGRAVISQLGEHDAAYEYFRLTTVSGNTKMTKGDARAYVQAMRDDPTV